MTEKTNVPEIRFAGFTDPWEQRKLGDVAAVYDGVHQTPDYQDEGVMFLSVENMATLTSQKFISREAFARDYPVYPKRGDVLMTRIGDIGTSNVVETDDKLAFYVSLALLKPFNVDSYYLDKSLQSPSAKMELYRRTLHTAFPKKINKNQIAEVMLPIPRSRQEQEQIGALFRNLDTLITLHQRKHDKLVQLKKSMLDKMFPKPGETEPEIRFAGFTDPWEQRKLGDICERHKEMVPTPKDGYVRMGVRSHAKGTFLTMVKPGAEIEEKELSRVKAHCLVVNIVFAWEQAIAITSTEDEKALVSHRFPQFLFHDDMHPDYFRYAILNDSFERHLWLASPSGAGRNKTLNVGTMLEYSFTLPNKKEQEAIASCLTRLDSLITLHQRKLELLRNTKKSLLERMFV